MIGWCFSISQSQPCFLLKAFSWLWPVVVRSYNNVPSILENVLLMKHSYTAGPPTLQTVAASTTIRRGWEDIPPMNGWGVSLWKNDNQISLKVMFNAPNSHWVWKWISWCQSDTKQPTTVAFRMFPFVRGIYLMATNKTCGIRITNL